MAMKNNITTKMKHLVLQVFALLLLSTTYGYSQFFDQGKVSFTLAEAQTYAMENNLNVENEFYLAKDVCVSI